MTKLYRPTTRFVCIDERRI